MSKNAFLFLMLPIAWLNASCTGWSQEFENLEPGSSVEVQIESTWHPGIVVAQNGSTFKVRYCDLKSGEFIEKIFFQPEMRIGNPSAFLPVSQNIRTWVSTKGTEAIAELKFCDGNNVVLKRNEKTIVVPVSKLSEPDKFYLQEQRKLSADASLKKKGSSPKTLKELIGFDKDEFLKKMQRDQERMLRQMEGFNDEQDPSEMSRGSKFEEDEDLKVLNDMIRNLDEFGASPRHKKQLEAMKKRIQDFRENGRSEFPRLRTRSADTSNDRKSKQTTGAEISPDTSQSAESTDKLKHTQRSQIPIATSPIATSPNQLSSESTNLPPTSRKSNSDYYIRFGLAAAALVFIFGISGIFVYGIVWVINKSVKKNSNL